MAQLEGGGVLQMMWRKCRLAVMQLLQVPSTGLGSLSAGRKRRVGDVVNPAPTPLPAGALCKPLATPDTPPGPAQSHTLPVKEVVLIRPL